MQHYFLKGDKTVDNSIQFPLSGAVTQSINPWDFWIKSLSSQLGFINIRNVTSSDYRIEQEIIEDVASYGRQIGQITDVLKVLIDHSAMGDLQEDQKQTIGRFEKMISEIEQVKKKWKTPKNLLSEIDTMLSEIRALKTESPATYELAVNKIEEALGKKAK
ncbi:hypothetical protein [Desulfosarcina ovata]|uniref:hypothetical protein n=1 Tax=Desulfosarcina ovata TaxID=83564 RepID=UPI0012D34E30|nr:hypothetical protein [Desulfosarcina ovata]